MQANSYNIGKTLAIIVTYTILYKIVLLLQRTSICHAQHWPTTPKSSSDREDSDDNSSSLPRPKEYGNVLSGPRVAFLTSSTISGSTGKTTEYELLICIQSSSWESICLGGWRVFSPSKSLSSELSVGR